MNWIEVLTIIGTLTFIFISIGYAFFQIVKVKFDKVEQSQDHIRELLSNHITETTDKIKTLNSENKERFNKLDSKIEKLDSKLDDLLKVIVTKNQSS